MKLSNERLTELLAKGFSAQEIATQNGMNVGNIYRRIRQLVSTPKADQVERTLVISDIHFPYHSPAVVNLFIALAKKIKPDRIVVLGDLLDCRSLTTKFEEEAVNFTDNRIKYEIVQGHAFLKVMKTLCDDVVFMEGNHEFRLQRYIAKKAKALMELFDMADLLKCNELGVKHYSYGEFFESGGVFYVHGDLSRSNSAYSAKSLWEKYNVGTILMGHTHRIGQYYKSDLAGVHSASEIGCACDLNQHYTIGPNNWQSGFALVETNSEQINVNCIPVRNDGIIWDGVSIKNSEVEQYTWGS